MRAFIGFLFFGLVALVAGTLGFQAGVASALAGGTGNSAAVWFLIGGPHLGGLFFLFIVFAIVMAISGARRRRHWHRAWTSGPDGSPMGRGPWSGSGPMGGRFADGDRGRAWVSEMHRTLHEADAAQAAATAAKASGTAGTGTAGTGTAAG